MAATHRVDRPEAGAFLSDPYSGRASHLEELGEGDWSRAFSFRLNGLSLVVRFGRYGEDFVKDREAMAFAGPDVPVPRVLEIGEAFGGAYAISERHVGVFLETLDAQRFLRLVPALLRAFDALRNVPARPGARVITGDGGDVEPVMWRDWLVETLVDRPGQRVSGWRPGLDSDPELAALFTAGEHRLLGLLDVCPEIGHIVHCDLLNSNVLVSEDGSRLHAVFDWGCSFYGDFLYDVAWFTFWAPWFSGLAAVDFHAAVRSHYLSHDVAVPSFDERLRCYELHIGLIHLAYTTCTGQHDDRLLIAGRMRQLLSSAGGPG